MRLPNAEKAIVDLRKIRDYCLNRDHPRGKHKARVFWSRFGLTQEDTELLARAIVDAAQTHDCSRGRSDEFGDRFLLDFTFNIGDNTALVRTAWIIRSGEDAPRLTTCYVL